MRSITHSAKICAVMILIVAAVMTPLSVSAAEKHGTDPKITLNSSDPFEFSTIDDKRAFLRETADYPESFDLRDERCVTPVKLQNPFGSCWGFAAIGAAETSIIGSGLADQEGYDASTLDLSEKHLSYFASSYLDMPGFSQDGEGTHHWDGTPSSEIMNIGGNPVLATNTFASGTGPVYESSSPEYVYKGKNENIDKRWFDGKYHNFSYSSEDDWSIDKDLRFAQNFILKESYMLPSPAHISDKKEYTYNPAGTAAIKEQLLKKRGVEIGFCADVSSPTQDAGKEGLYISRNWAHYTWDPEAMANHAVQIVGWDDNYPRESFIKDHMPPADMFPDGQHEGATDGGNGAWLVKNSWGSGEVDFPNKGEGSWGIEKDGVHTGYFWLSYYDMSVDMPEALDFDKANDDDGYYLDQYDFMQVHEISSSSLDQEAKMSNVFQAEVSEFLEEVSCMTTAPDTDVVYEVYLLEQNYQNPEDGILVARMEDSYKYGGFHKKEVEPCGLFQNDRILIQKGQYYSIVVTMKTANGKYTVNTPIAYGDKESNKHYEVGIINKMESFVMTDGSWNDYSDEDVRNSIFKNTDIDKPAFDNFPIKGFCKATGNDIAIRTTDSLLMPIFRDMTETVKIRLTGSKDAVIPDDPKITWSVYDKTESGKELLSVQPFDNGAKLVITPLEICDSMEAYLIINVEGVGTNVIPVEIFRFAPMVASWHDHDDDNKPLGAVYTGKPVEPGVDIKLDSPYDIVLNKDTEYKIEYKDNIKCGAGYISVVGTGELEPTGFTELFPVLPQKAEIRKISKGPGSLTVTVKDQKKSGITGYKVLYRPAGSKGKWSSKKFGTKSVKLKVTGLKAGTTYEAAVCGTVYIPPKKRSWSLNDYYDGEMSEARTVRITEPSRTTIKTLKSNKKKNAVTVKWKKASGVTGYQISYSTDSKSRRNIKNVTVKKQKTTKKLIAGLKKGRRYYFRIRTYKKNNSSRIFSKWSKVKSKTV